MLEEIDITDFETKYSTYIEFNLDTDILQKDGLNIQ